MTIERCMTISITDLNKKSFLNNSKTVSVMSWTKDNELYLSVDVEMFIDKNERNIILTHKNKNTKNETETYKVSIISIPSNLGNGLILYFVCPKTGKYCRKTL